MKIFGTGNKYNSKAGPKSKVQRIATRSNIKLLLKLHSSASHSLKTPGLLGGLSHSSSLFFNNQRIN